MPQLTAQSFRVDLGKQGLESENKEKKLYFMYKNSVLLLFCLKYLLVKD